VALAGAVCASKGSLYDEWPVVFVSTPVFFPFSPPPPSFRRRRRIFHLARSPPHPKMAIKRHPLARRQRGSSFVYTRGARSRRERASEPSFRHIICRENETGALSTKSRPRWLRMRLQNRRGRPKPNFLPLPRTARTSHINCPRRPAPETVMCFCRENRQGPFTRDTDAQRSLNNSLQRRRRRRRRGRRRPWPPSSFNLIALFHRTQEEEEEDTQAFVRELLRSGVRFPVVLQVAVAHDSGRGKGRTREHHYHICP